MEINNKQPDEDKVSITQKQEAQQSLMARVTAVLELAGIDSSSENAQRIWDNVIRKAEEEGLLEPSAITRAETND